MNNEKIIKIYIEGGCLVDVLNLPPEYTYELIDYDNEEERKDNYDRRTTRTKSKRFNECIF